MPRLTFTAALLLATCAFAQPEYVCRVTATAPVVDGVLDDPCWRDASAPPVVSELGVGGKAAPNKTQFRMLMDEKALYVAVDATTAPGVPPNAKPREHDPKSWGDDCIEILLAPSFVGKDYYHLILTAAGVQTDSFSQEGMSPDEFVKWNPAWQAVTKTRPGGWTAEMLVPWEGFGLKAAPPRGHVWRTKLAVVARGFPHSMWPRNETQSFHEDTWAYTIFRDPSLVTNGHFEAGLDGKGGLEARTTTPEGFMYAYYDKEGQGVCSVTGEDHVSGKLAGRLEKTDDKDWFPVFYTRELPVQPGSTYELRAMIRCDHPFVMRYNLSGQRGSKLSQPMPATNGWAPVTMQATIPDTGADRMTVGWQLIRTRGVILIDDVSVRRLNDIRAVVAAEKIPHPYHNLQELATRTAVKPHSLLRQADGWYQPDRVIFKDTGTGAEIWMMARSAGSSTRHQYMEMSPWNADGSLLALFGGQLGRGTILMDAATGAYRACAFYASANQWDRRDPSRIYFRNYRGHEKTDLWDLAWGNVLTGETTIGRRFEGDISLWPMSQDGEKLLVQERLVGADGKSYSHLWLMNRDCGGGLMLDPGGLTHQTWFNKLPDYSIEFEWEGQTPAGQYTITTDGKVRKLFDQTTGHRAHSPNGEWIAVMAGCGIRNFKTGELTVISPVSSDHQTWETDNSWYCTSSGRYLRRVVAFGSSTQQLLGAHNSSLKHSTYWTEAHPEMSADGTKLGYASCMLGDIEFYQLIMRQPGSPEGPALSRPAAGSVRLTWKAPPCHKEIKGYLVYRATHSGVWGEQITPQPVAALEFTDRPPAGPAYYRITSVEPGGLESLPSAEVCSDPRWPGAATVSAEAEAGKYAAPAVETFDTNAAGLYGVLLGQLKPSGPLTVSLATPKAAAWQVWARARGEGRLSATVDSTPLGSVATPEKAVGWVKLGETKALKVGMHEVALTPSAAGIAVDRVMLTTDAALTPQGLGGMDEQSPAAPTALTAQAEGKYAVRLKWQPATAPDFHHYNIYCGRSADLKPVQERLIASPALTEWVDWGLKPGTAYHYCVTAVDRSGHESAPSPVATVITAPLPSRLFAKLDQTWDTTQQPSIELPFTLPADGDWVVWGKVQSLDGKGGGLKLALDGKDLGRQGIPFGYISLGHGGPVLKTWLWHCLKAPKTAPDAPLAFTAPAGVHTVRLTADTGLQALFEGFVITNDLGYVPEGTTNFRVEP
ncbi:fibronectin type III domain-containing protein [bacterium]|nr:fibronectin type III domain-containing protein [bacterium]